MTKNKHLTNEERKQIEQLLRENVSIKKIAQKLGKSTSTISREIRAHALDTIKWPSYRVHNNCVKRTDCNIQYLCGDEKPNCTKRCSPCRNLCNTLCKHYDEELCYKLHEPPYVCNGCSFEYQCVLHKKYYFNKKAHDAYRETLVESRTGANITEDEIQRLDALVSPLVRRGQSVHHIIVNNPDQFDVSEKSIYRYIDAGLLQARNIDMPRVCRIKPRKSKPVAHKVDKKCRIGRTYPEFKNFMESNDVHAVEMDTVLGRIGGKVLLTLMFKSCDFMLAFIRDHNTSQSVIDIFNSIYQLLGVDCFRKMFPVILTDNGSEFSNPKALESDA